MTSAKNIIHIVCGPTASGKSAHAMDLARAQNGVIINCDSMQIYDDLPILSAQPSAAEREEIPHKLYDTLHPNIVCSAGNWREMAVPVINTILENNQTPVVCGGTGLYIKALMEGLSPMPDIPQDIRAQTIAKYETMGAQSFYDELRARDPIMAERFHAGHKARIIRAMEVLDATGKSLAQWQELPRTPPPPHWSFQVHKAMPEREILYKRCNLRFEWMVENGALEETAAFDKRLKSGEVAEGVPLTKALGFAELRSYLQGEIPLDEAITRAQGITRRYAKRQTTWFNNQL